MPDETTGGAPLSASIGEQLEEKRVLDQQSSAEKEAATAEDQRIERRKVEERAEVAKHLGTEASPEGWRARRQGARERGRKLAWIRDQAPVLALPLATVAGLILGLVAGPRKKGFPLAGAVVGGWLLWRRRALPAG